jgi:UDPglucose 6-dehydrogenase
MKICCIGAGYVGGPTMAMIALKAPHRGAGGGHERGPDRGVEFGDTADLRTGPGRSRAADPRAEPVFSTDVAGASSAADIIFVAVNTPTKTYGVGAGRAADLRFIESVARTIAEHANGPKIIVEKSTIPVKTAETIKDILTRMRAGRFEVLSNPEFLAEGTAMADLTRIRIGC